MKRAISLLSLTAVVAVAGVARAEPAPEVHLPTWTVTVDPATTALGFVHVQVERVLAPRLSIYVGPHARLFDSVFASESEDYVGIGVEVGVRWFFSDTAPLRWWAGARGVAAGLQADVADGTERAFGGYASVLAGYTWQANSWLVLSGGAGVQYLHYQVAGLGPEGVLPALHTTAGIAF